MLLLLLPHITGCFCFLLETTAILREISVKSEFRYGIVETGELTRTPTTDEGVVVVESSSLLLLLQLVGTLLLQLQVDRY